MPFNSEGREEGVALALSGGGYRAVLFHCGALLRLNELGMLSGLARVSSVSGGSIVAGGRRARDQTAQPHSRQQRSFKNFTGEVIEPLRSFCGRTLDVGAVLWGAVKPFKTAGEELLEAYRDRLGLGIALKALTKGPRFVSFAQLARVADIGLNQALALRKRLLIDCFQRKEAFGTYWGIGTLIGDYGLGDDTLAVSPTKTASLAAIRTRLNSFTEPEQEELINWCYAVSDAALRAHVPAASGLTYGGSVWPFPGRKMS